MKEDQKKRIQSKLEDLTPQERMDLEKCLNWLLCRYQEKLRKG